MIEYIIKVSLIAVVAIGGMTGLTISVADVFCDIGNIFQTSESSTGGVGGFRDKYGFDFTTGQCKHISLYNETPDYINQCEQYKEWGLIDFPCDFSSDSERCRQYEAYGWWTCND